MPLYTMIYTTYCILHPFDEFRIGLMRKKGEVVRIGEFVGGGAKQDWGAVKRFGKDVKEGV